MKPPKSNAIPQSGGINRFGLLHLTICADSVAIDQKNVDLVKSTDPVGVREFAQRVGSRQATN